MKTRNQAPDQRLRIARQCLSPRPDCSSEGSVNSASSRSQVLTGTGMRIAGVRTGSAFTIAAVKVAAFLLGDLGLMADQEAGPARELVIGLGMT